MIATSSTPTDKRRGEQILAKVSRQAFRRGICPTFSFFRPTELIATAGLYLDVERQNQANQHHAERLELAERSLQANSELVNYRPGSVQGVQTSAPTGSVVYFLDNGRNSSRGSMPV